MDLRTSNHISAFATFLKVCDTYTRMKCSAVAALDASILTKVIVERV